MSLPCGRQRGHRDARIEKILGSNYARLFTEVCGWGRSVATQPVEAAGARIRRFCRYNTTAASTAATAPVSGTEASVA